MENTCLCDHVCVRVYVTLSCSHYLPFPVCLLSLSPHFSVCPSADAPLPLPLSVSAAGCTVIEDPLHAISQLAQTTMRSEIGKLDLDKVGGGGHPGRTCHHGYCGPLNLWTLSLSLAPHTDSVLYISLCFVADLRGTRILEHAHRARHPRDRGGLGTQDSEI